MKALDFKTISNLKFKNLEKPKLVLGDGPETVYLYYDPMERVLAQALGWPRWRCKLGSTRESGWQRILQQKTWTAFAYTPVFGLEIRTLNAAWVEAQLQEKLQGFQVEGALGTEWYWTTPIDVMSLFKKLPEPPERKRPVPFQDQPALTPENIQQLFAKARELAEASHTNGAKRRLYLVQFLYYSACKTSEATKVTWGDLIERPDGDYDLQGTKYTRPLPRKFVLELKKLRGRDPRIFNVGARQIQHIVSDLGELVWVGTTLTPALLRRSARWHEAPSFYGLLQKTGLYDAMA